MDALWEVLDTSTGEPTSEHSDYDEADHAAMHLGHCYDAPLRFQVRAIQVCPHCGRRVSVCESEGRT